MDSIVDNLTRQINWSFCYLFLTKYEIRQSAPQNDRR
jgi:hypothetical protein